MTLGFSDRHAQTLDVERRGKEFVTTIASRGVTKRAAVRTARLEAKELIPLRDQDIIDVLPDRSMSPLTRRYIIRIAHNEDTGWRSNY